VHVPLPVEPQVAVQATVEPGTQAESSSVIVSQSSSRPLQPSAGGVQAAGPGTVQLAVQMPVPVEPQRVVQATAVPAAQAAGSSVNPSQSSSPRGTYHGVAAVGQLSQASPHASPSAPQERFTRMRTTAWYSLRPISASAASSACWSVRSGQ
jgi:hypothetical protein